jgi:hypothetical protein|tara:strand:- start:1185 stop:1388 length:204 start_codon:yes stop_codon:yes gene_type:complete
MGRCASPFLRLGAKQGLPADLSTNTVLDSFTYGDYFCIRVQLGTLYLSIYRRKKAKPSHKKISFDYS